MAYCITSSVILVTLSGTLAYGGNDWIILRYADVILMMAEVYEALGEETKAIPYLDEVRERQDYQVILNLSKIPTTEVNIRH